MKQSKLAEYSAKRKFEATPEPAPAASEARSGPLLFVIQQHSARRLHYDFRLECDGVLKSWAVPKGPSLDPSEKRLAVQTEDHPYEYASFEGVIPPGQYGAGEVIVWDCGVYSPDEGGEYWFHDREEAERQAREGLEQGKLSFLLRGEKAKGSFALVRSSDKKNWFLIKHKDRYAARADVTAQNRSVLSGMALEDLKVLPVQRMPASRLVPAGRTEAMPAALSPMHAESGGAAESRTDGAGGPLLLRSGAFRGRRSAQGALQGSAPLPRPMPSAFSARAARSRIGRRDGVIRGCACKRPGGSRRQAQGQPLRSRPALGVMAEGEADPQRRIRHRRLHQGEGLAPAARRAAGRLLGRGQAALRLARRIWLRRGEPRAGEGAIGASGNEHLSVRRKAGAPRPDDLGGACRRRRSEIPELDRRRLSARACVSAFARRR